MLKSGIIIGIVALVLGLGTTLISPLCTPCLAVLFGLGAGYLAGVFDKPAQGSETVKSGGIAGGISGLGAMAGQIIGSVINSLIVGPQGAAQMLRNFGFQPGDLATFESSYWVGIVGSTLCISMINILLMAGFGILGALIWGKLVRDREGNPSGDDI
jgi:hypothetical protein